MGRHNYLGFVSDLLYQGTQEHYRIRVKSEFTLIDKDDRGAMFERLQEQRGQPDEPKSPVGESRSIEVRVG